ncbi:L,D-transpeptidase family protein [Halomonas ramblicola]|uniref:L,D-transpeptidase family protein n=1 Tax=Halomonas ramblicola TaxID=747349 RepID=UPI0025B4285C|nr:L,D-transpeptidase family protein [Halomonas ramblicola]MDN3523252.1 L,D-transpeptidase family protein [Halomonas ramblicola]
MRAVVALGWALVMMLGLSGMALAGEEEASEKAATAPLARLLGEAAPELRAFYAARDRRPAWQERRTVAAFAEALQGLEGDGLEPRDYRPDELLADYRRAHAGSDEEAQARFELAATRRLLRAVEHLQRGRFDPREVEPSWEIPVAPARFDMPALSRAVESRHFAQAFAEARPEHAAYTRLRDGLARYRRIARLGGWPQLPAREDALRPGDVHDDVVVLRERLAVIGELEVMAAGLAVPQPRRYDATLETAVERFQRRHLLETDGIVGPRTRDALNVPVARRIDQIRLNLERARWLLHDLPEAFVLVDIAGYRIRYHRPNGETWRSRIVVGQPYRHTPSLRSEITHLTVNPSWTIPPTILREDVLPKVRRDLGYLWRERIQVLSPSGEPLDPWRVDWEDPGNIVLRQVPGDDNPLGDLVIRFPNAHMVYLHDTPSQGLFGREQRAFSSGCIRVQGVHELAQLLFEDTGTAHDIRALVAAGRTRNVSLARRMPVILHYATVHADAEGVLSFRPDIYGRDATLLAALDAPQ